jgi:hypothetical protein
VIVLATVLVAAAAMSVMAASGASAARQASKVRPMTTVRALKGTTHRVGPHVPTLQTWSSKVKVSGTTYNYTMVGKNPKKVQTSPSTTVTVPVIPLIIKYAGYTSDPTVVHTGCETKSALDRFVASPIFDSTTTYHMNGVSEGPTQYVDAFQRANFYKFTKPSGKNPGYHVNLSYSVEPAITVNAPAGSTHGSGCSQYGSVEINWFDNYVINTLFPQVEASDGVTPAQFPLFLVRSVVWYISTPANCCVLGYHGAFNNPRFGNTLQTYSPTDMELSGAFGGITDTSVAAHEVAEWMDDPTGNNPTPAWGHIGQVSGCQNNLEVGDPLTGTNIPLVTLGGFSYHLQELAFFSWFYHQSPSWGAGGKYSDNGTFTTFAATCT